MLEAEGPEAGLEVAEVHTAVTENVCARVFECMARIDLADVLTRLPDAQPERAARELARAAQQIEEMGASALRPRIHEVRALLDPAVRERELREAHRLYAEMGSAHEARIAALLEA